MPIHNAGRSEKKIVKLCLKKIFGAMHFSIAKILKKTKSNHVDVMNMVIKMK